MIYNVIIQRDCYSECCLAHNVLYHFQNCCQYQCLAIISTIDCYCYLSYFRNRYLYAILIVIYSWTFQCLNLKLRRKGQQSTTDMKELKYMVGYFLSSDHRYISLICRNLKGPGNFNINLSLNQLLKFSHLDD